MKRVQRTTRNRFWVIVIGCMGLCGLSSVQVNADAAQPTWTGRIVDVSGPLHYHADHGWIHLPGGDLQSPWVHSPGLGWFWVDPALYPYFYGARLGEWYRFQGVRNGTARYLNLRTQLPEDDLMAHTVDDWSSRLETVRAQYNLPAIAMVHLQGGRIQAEGVAGERVKGQSENLATLEDRYHIGSITKSMTAVLAAFAVQDGLLGWDTQLATLPGLSPSTQNGLITLGQLLNHTSGMPGIIPNYNAWFGRTEPLLEQREDWLETGATTALQSAPGAAYSYSNWGYVVAGAVLEQLTSTPWETLIQAWLFEPLGISSAGFGAPQGATAPWGHTESGQPMNPTNIGADNAAVLGPAGTVHMTVRDLATYGAFHLVGSKGAAPLLSQTGFDALHTPTGGAAIAANYAYGWVVGNTPRYLWHNGSNTMNFAYLLVLPDHDAVIALVTNQGGTSAQTALNAVQAEVLEHYGLPKVF